MMHPAKIFVVLSLVLALGGCSYWGGGRDRDAQNWNHIGDGVERTPNIGTRYIYLRHAVSGDTYAGFYARDGEYVPEARDNINRLMRDQRTDEVRNIDGRLLNFMTDIRRAMALPEDQLFVVLSGFRSLASNSETSRSRQSLHTQGMAVDIRVPGVSGKAFAEVARSLARGGVAYYPRTDHIHLDVGAIRDWQSQ
jgi:uncharacterized protein YcbK (DUF882 family)